MGFWGFGVLGFWGFNRLGIKGSFGNLFWHESSLRVELRQGSVVGKFIGGLTVRGWLLSQPVGTFLASHISFRISYGGNVSSVGRLGLGRIFGRRAPHDFRVCSLVLCCGSVGAKSDRIGCAPSYLVCCFLCSIKVLSGALALSYGGCKDVKDLEEK